MDRIYGNERVNGGAAPRALHTPGEDGEGVTNVYTLLLKRRQTPVTRNKNVRDEARLCAQVVAGTLTLAQLAVRLGVRRASIGDFLLAWGINPQTRLLMTVAATEQEVELAA